MKSVIRKIKEKRPNKSVVNYSKTQLLVVNKNGRVVLTTGIHSNNSFEAMIVYDPEPINIGLHSVEWLKNDFIHPLADNIKIIIKQ